MIFRAFTLLLGAALWCAAAQPEARARTLTIIDRTGDPETTRTLDRAALDALTQARLTTRTPWDDAPTLFEGPSGAAIAALAEGPCATVEARALNDFVMEIPFADFAENRLIVATRRAGEPMPIREKGPFWIMYDFDGATAVEFELWGSRSVWQLQTLVFKP